MSKTTEEFYEAQKKLNQEAAELFASVREDAKTLSRYSKDSWQELVNALSYLVIYTDVVYVKVSDIVDLFREYAKESSLYAFDMQADALEAAAFRILNQTRIGKKK